MSAINLQTSVGFMKQPLFFDLQLSKILKK
ncbi:hypothetical protein OEOE_0216 [Oenococcus oeni PSU-1]|uniref:Uncharacterized protein n=1 Tax=Oenococcus oeni (strain ATCC BAA-331 / PSU-1) TaxID=203123 RepID=Q04H69_OENOB|nr:hypothetical protein OEOE_0216 [Oenococcus oeni PSU-1]